MIKLFFFFCLLAITGYADPNNVDKQFLELKNIVKNAGAEQGKSGMTASGGTFTITTTAANVASGGAAFSWDASGAQTLRSTTFTIPSGLYSNNCLLKIKYKGGDTNLTLQALDGSNVVLGSQALAVQSAWKTETVSFVCPSSGTLKWGLSAGANAAVVYVDDVYIGENYMVGMASQAIAYGGATWVGVSSCSWQTTSGSFGNYSADSDCTTPSGGNLKGNAIAPATKVPGVRFSSLPPGRYFVTATGTFLKGGVSADCYWRFHDGTTGAQSQATSTNTTNTLLTSQVFGWFDYSTTQSNVTIQIQAHGDGVVGCDVNASVSGDRELDIQVYRFPTSQDQVLRTDQVGWHVDANISGANPAMGSSNVTSYTEITDSGLAMVQNSGSIGVQIPCSTTNPSTGLTCAAGSESIGVVYNQPVAGPVMACVSFSHESTVTTSGFVYATFQIVETPNAAQTISSEGGSRVQDANDPGGSDAHTIRFPHRVCGVFNFASAGQKTLRLMYEQSTNATVSTNQLAMDGTGGEGQKDMHWEVYPIGQYVSQPVIVNSISSNGTGPWRIEAANLNCDSGSALTSQTGTWISSIGNISSGACTVTFAAGAFSVAPYCVGNAINGGVVNHLISVNASSTSSVNVQCVVAGAACTAYDLNLLCMGAR